MKKILIVDPLDNVGVATSDIDLGVLINLSDNTITANQAIPTGHKIAINDIKKNEYIFKYGVPIGLASENILKGDYVHTNNVIDNTEELCRHYIENFQKGV